jgi:hypothetical protein
MKKSYLIAIVVFILLIVIGIFFWLENKKITNINSINIIGEDYRSRVTSLQETVAQKLNQPLDLVYVNISQEGKDYTKGIYTINNNSAGVFLAKKNNNSWEVIYIKDRTYTCEEVLSLEVPTELTSDCIKK